MLAGERLLIIEDEFLIALGIQSALEEADAQHAAFARNFEEAAALAGRFGEFDLAIVPPPRPGTADETTVAQLVAAGVALVVCTATISDPGDSPLAGAEMVTKPFLDDELLAACRRALSKRRR